MDALEALRQYFGFGEFRPGQEAIVRTILAGRDTLVIMPTGGGKSLCYQLPALLLPGATLVISPLIALMKDQVDALLARGIAAATINSSLSASEQQDRITALERGELKLLYVAPERFGHRRFVEALRSVQVSLVAIDEAHCVSQWGHDFRPDYLKIGRALEQLGTDVPVAAFTATATPDVRDDIIRQVGLREPERFVTGFARENLAFNVVQASKKREKFAHLRKLVKTHKTGIIYCATRKRVEEVHEEVAAWGTRSVMYHAGMSEEGRNNAQERFISRLADVAVATNAFGMGIDRSDIRFVAHYEIPGSVEAYYQEAGRAGRDGKPGRCDLLFSHADRRVQEFFIEGSNPGRPTICLLWDFLRRTADEHQEVHLSVGSIAEALGADNEMAIGSALSTLMRNGLVDRFDIPGQRMRGTRVLFPDLPGSKLEIDDKALLEKERRDWARLQGVLDYGMSGGCRQAWMLHYFGDMSAHECGLCDWCARGEREGLEPLDDEQMEILRKALAGVARMSRRLGRESWEGLYGVVRICEVLCGRLKAQNSGHGLDQLSTFGILADEGVEFVRALLDECLRMALLRSSGGDRPTVMLTAYGTSVMRGDATPALVWPSTAKQDAAPARTRNPKSPSLLLTGEDAPDADLLAALKRKRMEIAKARGVPVYMIFPNAALEGLAALRPITVKQALAVPGIGKAKAERELPPFLSLISEHKGEG